MNKKSLQNFFSQIQQTSPLVASLEEWKEFDCGEDGIGKYILFEKLSKTLIEFWESDTLECQDILLILEHYVENGEENLKNIMHTDFFPSFNQTKITNKSEIIKSFGKKTLELFYHHQDLYGSDD